MAERNGAKNRYQVLNRFYEPGIERVYPYVGVGFVVMGAVKTGTPVDDLFAFDRMKKQVFNLGVRYIELDGLWLDRSSGYTAHEPVLFVPYPGGDWAPWRRFVVHMADIARRFDQSGLVVSDGKVITLHWWKEGEDEDDEFDQRVERLGVSAPELIAPAYARVSNMRRCGHIFSLAGVRVPGSVMEALAMQKSGNLVAEGRVFFELK